MAIILKDIVYDDLRDVEPAAAVTKGEVALRQDCYGVYMYDEDALTETTFLYKMKQCIADKKTGSGEAIISGDQLFGDPTDDYKVSPTKGVGFVFLGWARETVGASATTVIMEFDGTLSGLL